MASAVITDVTTTDTFSTPCSTWQLIYVSAKMEKAFLCREALVNLGTLPAHFPQVLPPRSQDSIASIDTTQYPACSCTRRGQEPSSIPSKVPSKGIYLHLKNG
ncbi:hypothetical protein PoB_007390500 [Plakobranchus ocellatus]|uniref:Uncharacterized protein n=1 Tax=Plakobranchus ocellatus TaxID=259542 RepID=A0AAV4DTM9_9GAST|nr:hypothetical protein PoB_007390500 [Plakobranchus ocellatus]